MNKIIMYLLNIFGVKIYMAIKISIFRIFMNFSNSGGSTAAKNFLNCTGYKPRSHFVGSSPKATYRTYKQN